MPKITQVIPPQLHEIIRDRIADILIDELQNQYNYTLDNDLMADISIEEKVTFDKNEFSKINISLVTANFDNQNVGQADGNYQYNIDVYCSSPSNNSTSGDVIATLRSEKLIGKCYSIIMNAIYRTLGFVQGGVKRVIASPISVGDISAGDARNTILARCVVTVTATQTTSLMSGQLAEGYDTAIKISETEGFKYTINN